MVRLIGLVALTTATSAMAADNNDQAAGVNVIMSFLPMAILYGIASLIAIWSGRIQRWMRMNVWIIGAFGMALVVAYVQWSTPGPSPTLMGLTGTWLLPCLVAAGIAAALSWPLWVAVTAAIAGFIALVAAFLSATS